MARAGADRDAIDSFRKLFDIAPDVMLVADADGRIVLASPQIEALLGYRADELGGQPADVVLPERLRAAYSRERRIFAAGQPPRALGRDTDLVALRKDGREFPVEIALAPMQLDSGAFVAVSLRDVTEAQQARATVKKRARYSEQLTQLSELTLASRHLDDLLAAVPSTLAKALEVEIVLVYLLDAARTRLACKAAHGLAPSQIEALHELHRPPSQPGYVLASGEVLVIDDYGAESRVRVNPLMLEMGMKSAIGVPLSNAGHHFGTLTARSSQLGHFKDDEVNFVKAAGNIIAAAINRLQAEEQLGHARRLESIGQLTGGIAHDFNNLLTVISGNLQLLDGAVRDDPLQARWVAAAMRAAARGAALTRNLLAFSRRQALRPRAVDLAQHLPRLVEMLNRTLGARIEILARVQPGLAPCVVDPGQLDSALINLALNARDAMPQGGRIDIEAGAATLEGEPDIKPGRYILISVSDTGIGMTPEVQARAFEPFFTTKEAGKGSGLGLSMVHGFAKQSGGHVSASSEPGIGTTVRLYLPFGDAAATSEDNANAEDIAGQREFILVVEDDADVREVAVSFLSGLGYQVLAAGDAQAALRELELEPRIALLFSDVVLAGSMTGPELAQLARARRPGLKVLLTTGYARDNLSAEGDTELALLRKPYRREELAAAVRTRLDTR